MISFEKVKKYCNEDISLIENYEKAISDQNQTWDCHHRRENIFSRKELVEIGEYFNRPASELIFLTPFEHRSLHFKGKTSHWKGKPLSEETRRKLSESHKGNKNMLGKHHSDEAKLKMSESHKGRVFTEEWKRKMSEAHKNMSKEYKQKLSEAKQGLLWFNNGTITVRAKSCPEGFVRGRLKKVKQI